MCSSQSEDSNAKATYSTHIGHVTGQVHTGSGDIEVKSFLVSASVATKEEFVAALEHLKNQLKIAQEEGLDDETVHYALTEIEAAQREAQEDSPKADRIQERLTQVKDLLVAAAGTTTAAVTVVTAINKLLPLLESAVQAVSRIF